MIVVKLSDREADTLASICEMYSENYAGTDDVCRGRKGYKFTGKEFAELEKKLRGD